MFSSFYIILCCCYIAQAKLQDEKIINPAKINQTFVLIGSTSNLFTLSFALFFSLFVTKFKVLKVYRRMRAAAEFPVFSFGVYFFYHCFTTIEEGFGKRGSELDLLDALQDEDEKGMKEKLILN